MNMALLFCIFRQFAESNGRPPNGWLVPRGYSTKMTKQDNKPPRSQSSSPISTPLLTTRTRSSSLPNGAASGSPKPEPGKLDSKLDHKTSFRRSKRPQSPLPQSPLASPLSSPSSSPKTKSTVPPNIEITENELDDAVRKKVKANCPCLNSSQGQAWLLVCQDCKQTWHNTCVNLNGEITQPVIDSILKSWKCPWCWKCPYPRPNKHIQAKNDDKVISKALATQIALDASESITQNIKNIIEEKTANFDSAETLLHELTSRISETLKVNQDMMTEVKTLSENVKNSFVTHPPLHTAHGGNAATATPIIESIKHAQTSIDQLEDVGSPYEDYKKDFVTVEQATELVTFLEQESFAKEGQREVMFYGQKYQYMGSRKNPKPIPPAIKPLLDKLNNNLDYKLNQVLVNKYTGPESSLPCHSDNEHDINPASSIFTVSLGDSATMMFTNIKTGEKSNLLVENRSLYKMTRDSQNDFKHGILPNEDNQIRYSLTFRCTHWSYLNSTYAVGDSNFGHIRFGEGRGKIGAATPGLKDWAAHVDDIDPKKSRSYKNVVVMCGTNNLKKPNMENEDEEILTTYRCYKGKLEEIRKVNPKCRLFVCPVLPTRDHGINNRVKQFNKFLFNDLAKSNINVSVVQGFAEFVDRSTGLLRHSLFEKRSESDVLHINDSGYRILVRCIKSAIFSSRDSQGSRLMKHPAYSHVVRPT